MEKEFIPYEQALALKELGFDELCLMYYDYSWTLVESGVYECKAPLYQQCFRWFREKHDLHCNIDPWGYCIFDDNGTEKTGFESYEEAELECLKKLIEIVKQK